MLASGVCAQSLLGKQIFGFARRMCGTETGRYLDDGKTARPSYGAVLELTGMRAKSRGLEEGQASGR